MANSRRPAPIVSIVWQKMAPSINPGWQESAPYVCAVPGVMGVITVPSMGPFMRFEMKVSSPSSAMPAISRYHQKFWRRS